MLAALIVGCEIGFWVFVLAGLVSRYIFKLRRLGAVLLFCTPLVDLVLLVAAVIDLRNGAAATLVHGISAVYIGVSVAYGHRMIQWADERFAHRFAQGPAPVKLPKFGQEHARRERANWNRHLLAWVIGSLILYSMILFVHNDARTAVLSSTITKWALILAIDWAWSYSYTFWPRKEKGAAR